MDRLAYSGINTTIRILEDKLLSKEDFEALLKASNLRDCLEYLSKTHYDVPVQELLENKDFERVLMKDLSEAYHRILSEIPELRLLEIFTALYTYHNLKVLLKGKFSEKAMDHLLIPIHQYPLETLKTLISTGDAEEVPLIMKEAVAEASDEFNNFHRLETADIFMDTYYFRHLKWLSEQVEDDVIHQIVQMKIDLENLSTLIRGVKKNLSRSFLHTIMSSSGTISKTKMIDAALEKGWNAVLELFDGKCYQEQIAEILSTSTQEIQVIDLELLMDKAIYDLLKEATFEAFGPYPTLAYIHAKEMEMKNLRLILVGKDNGFEENILRERMRPIYGS